MQRASKCMSASCTICTAAGWSTSAIRARRCSSRSSLLDEVLPAGERIRPALQQQFDALAFLDASDDREAARVLDRCEQLEVLAEPEVGVRRTLGERHALEIDHQAHAGATHVDLGFG